MKQALFLSLATIVLFCIFPLALTAGPRDTEAPPAKASDNAPPKPDAGKPADEANGLKIELSVVNAPLYPGDDLQIDVRLTNVQKEGDIQIIDFPILDVTMHPIAIGPDGQQITWPALAVSVAPPDSPTATLPPGAFYGRKISLDASQMRKPGRYAISVRYDNSETLKDKGFNCWTGNLQSNTAFFEVPDFSNVPAVDGIKMFVKAKPRYREDEPVMIEVRLYNSGDKEKAIYRPVVELLEARSTGQVKDEKGNVVEWTRTKVKAVSPEEVTLPPGQATTREYDLRSVCNLPAGKYTLELHSEISSPAEPPVEMVSNEVSFEIIPAEKPKGPVKGSEGISEGPFHMTINMAKEKYAEGEPVKFTISMKNVSDKEQKVYISKESLRDFIARIVIKNAEGKTVPWKIAPDGTRSEYDTAKLQPGEVFNKEYDLLEACDLPVGKYTLQMHSIEPGGPDMEVTFEILPAEKPQPAP